MTPEGKVVAECLEWLAKNRVFAWRNNTGEVRMPSGAWVRFGHPGSADILGIMNDGTGRMLCVECKAKTGGQRKDQELFERMVTRAGGIYIIARSTDDLATALERHLAQ